MAPSLRHPYLRALLPIGGLVGFSLLTFLLMWGFSSAGLSSPGLAVVSLVFCGFFSLIWSAIWLIGLFQLRRARMFLASDRPLLHWTYSAEEWGQMKAAIWQEEKADWPVSLGCLTFLFALSGFMTGVLLGLDGYFVNIVVNGFIGLILGGLFGVTVGALVAGGNYLAAQQAYRQAAPGQVALGVNEIYAQDQYFRGRGKTSGILAASLQQGTPAVLKLELLQPPRPRMPRTEEWLIPVPPQYVDQIEKILPMLLKTG